MRTRPIIHSTKHYVQQTRSQVATVSLASIDIIDSVESTLANVVDEVAEGSLVKAVFVEMWLLDTANDGSFVVTLGRYPSGLSAATFANSNALGAYNNKKNILYVTQGLSPNNGVGNPVPIIRQWFKIPKGLQRFGLGDKLRLTITNNGLNDLEFCGFFTYKELS